MATDIESIDPDSVFLKKKESKSTDSNESLIYPNDIKDYLKDCGIEFDKPKNKLETIVEKYEKSWIKPYIGTVDFNNDKSTPYENKPKIGYEIGIKFSF